MATRRKCGECRACCYAIGVSELGKPSWQNCKHECAQGCAIYQDRPGGCRVFECGWLEGLLGTAMRPDKLGLIFTKGRTLPRQGGSTIIAYEATRRFIPATEDAAREFDLIMQAHGDTTRAERRRPT